MNCIFIQKSVIGDIYFTVCQMWFLIHPTV